jgi:hypothetical protein
MAYHLPSSLLYRLVLDRLQRFSLAEYMCELLGTEGTTAETVRDKALAAIIANLASSSLADSPTYITPLAPPAAPGVQNGHSGQGSNEQRSNSQDGQGGKQPGGTKNAISEQSSTIPTQPTNE